MESNKLIRALRDTEKLRKISSVELRGIAKTLKQEKAILFGSIVTRIFGGKKAKLPVDVDLAVSNATLFVKRLKRNLTEK